MIIFDGVTYAKRKEVELKKQVEQLQQHGISLSIAAVLFTEDKGSQLYTQLKKQAAERIGIEYQVHSFSILEPIPQILSKLSQLDADPKVSGIIIQKPGKKRWIETHQQASQSVTNDDFTNWWHMLVTQIDEGKDVDGLHPATLAAIEAGNWRQAGKVMPATAKAVLDILVEVPSLDFGASSPKRKVHLPKIIILGKSDILGQPLFFELRNQGYSVEMIGSKELERRKEAGQGLQDADVVISATGHPYLVTGELIKSGAVIVDVGEPKPDVDRESVAAKAEFLTPVPGGVGPVTIVSLL